MVFLRTPAQTHNNALKSAFLRSREREKEVSLTLSLFLSSVCVVVVVVRTHRAWCVLKAKKRKKKKTIRKNFFCAREKAQNILQNSFRFFLSLSFSFSPVVVVVVACHHPERERERERGARISSKTLLVSRFAKHTCVCSLSVLSLLL
mgnify:CR=1 FL=1